MQDLLHTRKYVATIFMKYTIKPVKDNFCTCPKMNLLHAYF